MGEGRDEPGCLAGIVLAAGLGSRFGDEPKMLALWDGEAFVHRAVRAALEAGLAPVFVVTGHRADEIEAALAGLDVRYLRNPHYRDGMATSLKAGFAALPKTCAGAAILLGDMPAIDGALVARLAAAWLEAGAPKALVPVHDGRRGNPVILSMTIAGRIAELSGDRGAGPLLRDLDGIVTYDVEDPAVLLDVDSPEELRIVR